ncbi:transmembrane protein 238-like [Rhinophrynus dorsalis]
MALSRAGLGRCSCCFWLAVAFDGVGLAVLLIGVFANVFFYDFLIYAGSIVIFLSLIWWVFWYTGNIEVPPEELADDVGLSKKNNGVLGLVRTLSGRLSSSFRRSRTPRASRQGHRESPGPKSKRQERPVTVPMVPQLSSVSASLGKERRDMASQNTIQTFAV